MDNIDPEKNDKYSKELFSFFSEKLEIPDTRGYIAFNDPGRAYLGYVISFQPFCINYILSCARI